MEIFNSIGGATFTVGESTREARALTRVEIRLSHIDAAKAVEALICQVWASGDVEAKNELIRILLEAQEVLPQD
jgi:DNA-binding TFAR19-related protein (PDSD5 family)